MSVGSPFVIGIDLGTTNSAVAYLDLRTEQAGLPPVQVFAIPQLVGAGRVESRPLLPSFVYLPGPFELSPGALALPWDSERAFAVGEFARQQGSLVPGRLVGSAKSWLCHPGVDRRAAMLPWGAADDVALISPVEASARILSHIREAWNFVMASGKPDLKLEQQEVILTVPASFDEIARELTCEAATKAGIRRFTLLEEPQAAFYCWIQEHDGRWNQALPKGGTVLVVDIGGGTTDLSLISATPGRAGEPPSFERLAVGAHLLLGGDNMDLTLARHLEHRAAGGALSARQWTQLAHRCRDAKEQLLTAGGPEAVKVNVPGSSSKLIGGARVEELSVDLANSILLDGFFPVISADISSQRPARAGIQEFGLPYESEPAVPRHILAFLSAQAANVSESERSAGLVRPHAVLFNGGATRSAKVQARIVETIQGWFVGADPLGVLDNTRPDLAVALGAAYYGAVRRGLGVRIRGGSARAYYVTVGAANAQSEQEHLLCILPHGLEEGREVQVPRTLDLLTNRPVRFPVWSSSTRLSDPVGAVVDVAHHELQPLPPIQTVLQFGQKTQSTLIPVQLVAKVTEIGTLELACASAQTPHRWKLAFDLRATWSPEARAEQSSVGETLEETQLQAGREAVTACFQGSLSPAELPRALERAWERPRDQWPSSALRALWDSLRDNASARERSPEHEARWLNLAGFMLRPGRGFPGDELRVRELWSKLAAGVHHKRSAQAWVEWWVLWRRVAAGLSAGQQTQVYGTITPLILAKKVDTFKVGRPAPEGAELQEVWQCAASFERIEASSRVKLGDVALKFLTTKQLERFGLWVVGRVGARSPLYAGANAALPPAVAERWLREVLDNRWKLAIESAFDIAQLARLTGDRHRDVSPAIREELILRSAESKDGPRIAKLLHEVVAELDRKEQQHLFADSLPPGLVLRHE
jgi:molecular chaperone DnaK (HSP70)